MNETKILEDLISNEENGLLVEPTPDNIRSTIERVLADSALRKRLGENARDFVVRNYSLDKIFEKYKRIFEELTNNDSVC